LILELALVIGLGGACALLAGLGLVVRSAFRRERALLGIRLWLAGFALMMVAGTLFMITVEVAEARLAAVGGVLLTLVAVGLIPRVRTTP